MTFMWLKRLLIRDKPEDEKALERDVKNEREQFTVKQRRAYAVLDDFRRADAVIHRGQGGRNEF